MCPARLSCLVGDSHPGGPCSWPALRLRPEAGGSCWAPRAVPLRRPSQARACGRWACCSAPHAPSGAADEGQGHFTCGLQGPAELPPSTRWTLCGGGQRPVHTSRCALPARVAPCRCCSAGSAGRFCPSSGLCCPQVWRWSCGHLPPHAVLDGLVWPLQAPRGCLPSPWGPLRGRALPGPPHLGKPSSECGVGGLHPSSPSGNSGARPASPVRSAQQGGREPAGPRDRLSELSWGLGPQQDVEWPLDTLLVGGRGRGVAGAELRPGVRRLKREVGGEGPSCWWVSQVGEPGLPSSSGTSRRGVLGRNPGMGGPHEDGTGEWRRHRRPRGRAWQTLE